MKRFSAQWAWEVAQSHLESALPRRWSHTKGVASRADSLSGILRDDYDLVRAAAILHDVGYAPELAATGFHALDGARYLREVVHADDRIIRLVAHHSCAAIEAEERGLSDDLREFELEMPLLRDALIYCDMTTTPDGGPTDVFARIAEVSERYSSDGPVGRFMKRAGPDLCAATKRVEFLLAHSAQDLADVDGGPVLVEGMLDA